MVYGCVQRRIANLQYTYPRLTRELQVVSKPWAVAYCFISSSSTLQTPDVFTRDISKAMSFVEQTEVGLTHVNIMTAYKEPSMVFGGVKASAAGLPEAGQTGMEFFTDEKVVYIA